MSGVERHLKDLIRADGPISIAEYMRICLTARSDSYYRRADPLGAAGDFVTAPEVSQIFGELIGLWCADVWRRLGAPAAFDLVELGPGRGTMMRDALRAARAAPDFLDAASVHLVEVSEALRGVQRETLRESSPRVQWHDTIDAVAATKPSIILANEFFDALPVRQFVRAAAGWSERCVGFDENGELAVGLSPAGVVFKDLPPAVAAGAITERSPQRAAVARLIGERLVRTGGAALVIDYGFMGVALGDTLQAVRAHKFVDVLDRPGSADLTSHVDFTALADAFTAAGARVCAVTTQGAFLNDLGAAVRIAKLKERATPAQADALEAGYRRLTEVDAMGSLFKVLCAFSPPSLSPAGFPT